MCIDIEEHEKKRGKTPEGKIEDKGLPEAVKVAKIS